MFFQRRRISFLLLFVAPSSQQWNHTGSLLFEHAGIVLLLEIEKTRVVVVCMVVYHL
jgi:hypothetical protein